MKVVWYAHGYWEDSGSDSSSIFIDLDSGQGITLWGPSASAPLQYWAY